MELIIGSSKEQHLKMAKIYLFINIEERLETIQANVMKKIKIKAIKSKLDVKCKKEINIKVLGIPEEIFKEIMKNLFSEPNIKLSMEIQRVYYVLEKLEAETQ